MTVSPENSARRFSRKTPEDRRELLIAAAIRCLSEGGMTYFTIERICTEANVSRGLINHHFGSKENLLIETYKSMTGIYMELPAGGRFRSAEDELKILINTYVAPELFDLATFKAWLSIWGEIVVNSELNKLHRKRYAAYHKAWNSAIEAVAAERNIILNVTKAADQAIAFADGLWLKWCLDPSQISQEEVQLAVVETLEDALGPLN